MTAHTKQLCEMTIAEMAALYDWTWGRYRMLIDDPYVGLAAGDVIVCVGAHFDREKLIALFREVDRKVIGATVYRSGVTTIGNYSGPRQ